MERFIPRQPNKRNGYADQWMRRVIIPVVLIIGLIGLVNYVLHGEPVIKATGEQVQPRLAR